MNRDTTIPLYKQLQLKLQDRILLGEMGPGVLLPTEQQLCIEYGVSRITVRNALAALERNGLIDRIQGRGSVVRKRNVSMQQKVQGYTRSMLQKGMKPRSELIDKKLVIGNENLIELFQLPASEKHEFWVFRTLRYLNDLPAIIMTHYVRRELGDLMMAYDFENASFFGMYESILKQSIQDIDGLITAVQASPENAKLLKIDVGLPLIWYRCVAYLAGKIPIEVSYSLFVADKFQFETRMFKPIDTNFENEQNMTEMLTKSNISGEEVVV